MRTIIIGDIHGCQRALQGLLDRIAPDPAKDRLILLGDLFDRGPDSYEVWQTAMLLRKAYGERFVLLCGNHEDIWLKPKPSLSERWMHDRVGRKTTVTSFRSHGHNAEEALPWIAENAVPYYEQEELQCAHAGIRTEPISANDRQTLIHDHGIIYRNRYAGKLTVTGHVALEEACWFAGDEATRQPVRPGVVHPLPEHGVLCIDTGCGKGGRLTGMVVENGNYLLHQVPENGYA